MADPTDEPPDCEAEECYCPLTGVIETLSRKYAMQIVSVVGAYEPIRFGGIEDEIPTASTSTLSNRLEEFADAGLIERERYDEIPPRVEYSLTEDGHEVRERLQPLLEWATERE